MKKKGLLMEQYLFILHNPLATWEFTTGFRIGNNLRVNSHCLFEEMKMYLDGEDLNNEREVLIKIEEREKGKARKFGYYHALLRAYCKDVLCFRNMIIDLTKNPPLRLINLIKN